MKNPYDNLPIASPIHKETPIERNNTKRTSINKVPIDEIICVSAITVCLSSLSLDNSHVFLAYCSIFLMKLSISELESVILI